MLKIFKNLKKKDYLILLIIILLIFLQTYLDLKIPDYMSKITTLVETEGSLMSDILSNGAMMLLCALLSLAGAIITGFFTSLLSANISMNLREKLFNKVEDLSLGEIKQFSTSSLITRTTNDITQIQMFVAMGLQMLIKAPLTAVLAILKILNKSTQWSIITAIAIIILLSIVASLIMVVTPRFKIIQKLIDRLNGVTRESLTGIRVIRAFNAEDYEEDKFEKVNEDITNTHLFIQKRLSLMQPIMYLIMYGLTLAIYFVGANLINNANMADKITLFGDMIVFSSYAMQIIMSFLVLAMIFMILPRANVSFNRINEVLKSNNKILNGKIKKVDNKGTIEFRDVSFKYPDGDEELLRNINFKIEKGQTFAIIGSTGTGKSTLINLIPRLYDATKGSVLIDGVDVKEYDEEYLNSKIGFVTQKAILFNGTVEKNVSYGTKGKIDYKKLDKALSISQAKDFVYQMEDNIKSYISSGGTNISGGQKQRLAIARAIYKDPEIYIFDDSFSALDYKTDSKLRNALKKNIKDATIIIVAQRIGTIMNADNILVLDEGKIVGLGTHKELLKNCDVYKQIALSQLSAKELLNE